MPTSPIILVPGFWLGAWAWDEVAAALRAAGHEVTVLTLPGLGSADADRSSITLADHVEAICEAVTAAGSPVVLAVHSGTGFSGYAASDRMPELIAAMVYVDFAPGKGALAPDFDGAEKPMNWEEIAEEENLNGLSEEQLETFRQRAVPEPGGHPARGRSAEQRCAPRYPDHDHLHGLPVRAGQTYAQEHDWAWLAGVAELRDITWVDLPTSHWPMWSRPQELAQLIGNVAENTRRPA